MRGLRIFIFGASFDRNRFARRHHGAALLHLRLAQPLHVLSGLCFINSLLRSYRQVGAVMRDLEHIPQKPALVLVSLCGLDDLIDRFMVDVRHEQDSRLALPLQEGGLKNHAIPDYGRQSPSRLDAIQTDSG